MGIRKFLTTSGPRNMKVVVIVGRESQEKFAFYERILSWSLSSDLSRLDILDFRIELPNVRL